jgi:ribosomal 30S subunit maturation factor RimM
MTQGPDSVYLGFIRKAHGLSGGFVARLFSAGGEPGLPDGTRLRLTGEVSVTVRRSTPRDGFTALVTTEEIRTRDEAESLCGCEILIDREMAGTLGFLPLYGYIGLELRSGGRSLRVVDIEPVPGNPLLIVENDGGGRFPVPLAMLPEIPGDGSAVELRLPAGLEDL